MQHTKESEEEMCMEKGDLRVKIIFVQIPFLEPERKKKEHQSLLHTLQLLSLFIFPKNIF